MAAVTYRMTGSWSGACAALLLIPALLLAQTDNLRLPVIIDADQTTYDGKLSMVQFKGLRLTQGGLGIEADVAHASRMDFDDSVWHFSGNVVFDIDEGHIECDAADLEFSNFTLKVATIEGSPATFEFKREGSEDMTYASANKLHYDVAKAVIEFSGNATITEGSNKISSDTLVYKILEQRVNAVSSGNGGDRVKVIFTPPDEDPAPDAAATPEDNTDTSNEGSQ